MTTVTWIQDGNGNYEISSPEHLKQLMNDGALYTDAGTPPFSYWGSGTTYIQTADIDLSSDNTDIKPIGNFTTSFLASYDGAEYAISNYSYLDPNFSTSNQCEQYVGLFGNFQGEYLKNIRLTGVWTIEGFHQYAGFLVGYGVKTGTNTLHGIFNVVGDFATGTLFNTNTAPPFTYIGSILGIVSVPNVVGITVKGSIDFLDPDSTMRFTGGVGGVVTAYVGIRLVRNLATFPSGIKGSCVGGIFGRVVSVSCSYFLNAMTGNIIGFSPLNSTYGTGGIFGSMSDYRQISTVEYMVNSMTGNITSSVNTSMGGIFGFFDTEKNNHQYFLNYMTGNIGTTGDQTNVGGLIGSFPDTTGTINNSLNSMNGNVQNSTMGSVPPSSTAVNVVPNTNFGLTYTSNVLDEGTFSGLLTNPDFSDLPYFDLTGTDSHGNSYDFYFVFANLSGNSSYNNYTHVILHRQGQIATPLNVNFSVPENNTTLYVTYMNAGTNDVLQPNLQISLTPGTWNVEVRVINIKVGIGEVPGASSYRLTYEGPNGTEISAFSGFTDFSKNIVNLDPDTQYTIRLYADTGNGYEMTQSFSTTTLANASTNFVVADFLENGIFDLGTIDEETRAQLYNVMNEIFNTGDIVNVSTSDKLSFIKRSESLSIKNVNGVLLPFDAVNTGQNVSLVLSDDSTNVPVVYDESSNTITVDSTTYNPGSAFVLDGRKVSVLDY